MAGRRSDRPVDVVSEEEVVGARRVTVDVEVAQQVVVLSVDVAGDRQRDAELEQHRLVEEHCARLHAQLPDRAPRQLHLHAQRRRQMDPRDALPLARVHGRPHIGANGVS